MRVLIIGLEGAAPDLLFGDEQLQHVRWLMDAGCYGHLESVIPPLVASTWRCLATGSGPGGVGEIMQAATASTLWEEFDRGEARSLLIGVPESCLPQTASGGLAGWTLGADAHADAYVYPAHLADQILPLLGGQSAEVPPSQIPDLSVLHQGVSAASSARFEVVRQLVRSQDWDLLLFVESGLDHVQRWYWRYHDPALGRGGEASIYRDVVRAYYRRLDDELGRVLELVDDDTIILIMSTRSARRVDGTVFINEWLIQEGLLVLHEYPSEPTPFELLDVDWSSTTAWAAAGDYARLFVHVKGSERPGGVDSDDLGRVCDHLVDRLSALFDEHGQPLVAAVVRPAELDQATSADVADLLVCFRELSWRAASEVGASGRVARSHEDGYDEAANVPVGSFILVAPNSPLEGEIEGVRLVDLAPTLLELAGQAVPAAMTGRSLVRGLALERQPEDDLDPNAEQAIRDRLRGLGYIE